MSIQLNAPIICTSPTTWGETLGENENDWATLLVLMVTLQSSEDERRDRVTIVLANVFPCRTTSNPGSSITLAECWSLLWWSPESDARS